MAATALLVASGCLRSPLGEDTDSTTGSRATETFGDDTENSATITRGPDSDDDARPESNGSSWGDVEDIGDPNNMPTAADDAYFVRQGEVLIVGVESGILRNDRDPDGDRLRVVLFGDFTTDAGATVSIESDGSFRYVPLTTRWGEDVFEYVVSDGRGMEATAQVHMMVSPTAIELREVSYGYGGFVIDGEATLNFAGRGVSGSGDVNGDGFGDVLVGALGVDDGAGRSYVVFGPRTSGSPPLSLSVIAGGFGGFAIHGEVAGDRSGSSLSDVGDVNGDGLADLIIGAYTASPGGRTRAGRSYVVFGKADGFPTELDDDVALGFGGFTIDGEVASDSAGRVVRGAGDVNGDGLADVILGADGADSRTGRAYVVFGKSSGDGVQLADIAQGVGGFAILGEESSDRAGISVSGAGDVNGDDLADVIVGTHNDGSFRRSFSYVVFGRSAGTPTLLSDVAQGFGGFAIDGEGRTSTTFPGPGRAVAGVGDVDGDGLDDIVIDGGETVGSAGEALDRIFVVFGRSTGDVVSVADIAAGAGGFVIERDDGEFTPINHQLTTLDGAGDVNGDGLMDIVIGLPYADPRGISDSGRTYLVYGQSAASSISLAGIAQGIGGFAMDGERTTDGSGDSAKGAGDVNGDGFADVIVGALRFDLNGTASTGRSYVVFGGNFTGSAFGQTP